MKFQEWIFTVFVKIFKQIFYFYLFLPKDLFGGVLYENFGKFYISKFDDDDIDEDKKRNATKQLVFERNPEKRTFMVNGILEIHNEHLLGLHNPSLLFDLFDILGTLRNKTGLDICIVKNEIVISNFQPDCETKEALLDIFDKLEHLKIPNAFKIQLAPNNFLVFNRCLKTTPQIMQKILFKGGDEIIDIALRYFQCFSIQPICCRMQSLAPDAFVDATDKYSFFHLQKYCLKYIEISKLFFPYIADISNNDILFKKYLEIVPASLIRRKKLDNLIKMLKDFHEMGIPLIPLPDGRIRISGIMDVFSSSLLKFIDLMPLKKLHDLIVSTNWYSDIPNEEFLIYNPETYTEYGNIIILATTTSYKIQNLPSCKHDNPCNYSYNYYLKMMKDQNYTLPFSLTPTLAIIRVGVLSEMCIDTFNLPLRGNKMGKYLELADLLMKSLHNLKILDPYLIDINSMFYAKKISNDKIFVKLYANYEDCIADEAKAEYSAIQGRFFIETESQSHENHSEAYSKLFKDLLKLEEQEGICLSFINHTIETIEFFMFNMEEWLNGEEKIFLDEFYNTVEDLNKFFETISTKNLGNLSFTITDEGFIEFKNCLKIRPCTFLKIKNIDEFLEVIRTFCNQYAKEGIGNDILLQFDGKHHFYDYVPGTQLDITEMEQNFDIEKYQKFYSVKEYLEAEMFLLIKREYWEKRFSICNDKRMVIECAKLLNSKIDKIDDKFFFIKNFRCIPVYIFLQFPLQLEKMIATWRALKAQGMSIKIQPNYIVFETIINGMAHLLFLGNEMDLNEDFFHSLEDIFSNFDFKAKLVGNRIIINTIFLDATGDYYRLLPTNNENQKLLKRCLGAIQAILPSSNIGIKENGKLLLEQRIEIYPHYFDQLTTQNQIALLKFSKKYRNLFDINDKNLLSISDEKNEKRGEDVKGFSIIDTFEDTYIKIIKLLQPNLKCLEDQKILTNEHLKLIPRSLVSPNANVVLEKLHELQGYDLEIIMNDNGKFQIKNLELSVAQLTRIKDMPSLLELIEVIDSFRNDKNLEYILHSGGGFCEEKGDGKNANCDPRIAAIKLQQLFEKNLELAQSNTYTLDMHGNIMVGNFVWSPGKFINLEILLKMSRLYESAMEVAENDLMKSVSDLPDIDKAINIAQNLNPILIYLSNEILKSKNLKIFPNDLYIKWKMDSENYYKKLTSSYNKVHSLTIPYGINLNGCLCFEMNISLTVTEFLLVENIEELRNVVTLLLYTPLLCENDVKNGMFKEYKTFEKLASYRDIKEAKMAANKVCKGNNRIEPNGTLFFNKQIWIQPKEFLDNQEKIIKLSKDLKNIFKEEKVRFQYGSEIVPIALSLQQTDEENMYQYCQTFCAFIDEYEESISIKYNAEEKTFKFNDCIFIHPRSFFHLQDIQAFIEALKNYSDPKNKKSEKEKDEEFLANLKSNKDNLRGIKSLERLEYWPVRKRCLQLMGEILYKNKEKIHAFLPTITRQITDNPEEFYNVEKVAVNNKHIFLKGVANDFLKDNMALKYSDDEILVGLKIASKLDESFQCKTLFDFQSVLETIHEYVNGKYVENYKMCKGKPLAATLTLEQPVELEDLLNAFNTELQKIQTFQDKYKKEFAFSNPLKGLHHWFKHGEDFESLEDYYTKMNDFFKVCKNPDKEIDTQNGLKFIENYNSDDIFGGLVYDEIAKQKYVTTFYKDHTKKTKTLKFTKFDSKNFTDYLLLADITFPSSREEIKLDERITVKIDRLDNLLVATKRLPKNLNAQNVKMIMIISDTQMTDDEERKKKIEELIQKCKDKFKNERLQIYWYAHGIKDNQRIFSGIDAVNLKSLGSYFISTSAEDLKTMIETRMFN